MNTSPVTLGFEILRYEYKPCRCSAKTNLCKCYEEKNNAHHIVFRAFHIHALPYTYNYRWRADGATAGLVVT